MSETRTKSTIQISAFEVSSLLFKELSDLMGIERVCSMTLMCEVIGTDGGSLHWIGQRSMKRFGGRVKMAGEDFALMYSKAEEKAYKVSGQVAKHGAATTIRNAPEYHYTASILGSVGIPMKILSHRHVYYLQNCGAAGSTLYGRYGHSRDDDHHPANGRDLSLSS